MFIYLVKLAQASYYSWSYDFTDSAVIAANSEEEAIDYALSNFNDKSDVWLAKCIGTYNGEEKEATLILKSFNAG